MRPEALALFGLQEQWRTRSTVAGLAPVVVHLPDDLPIEDNTLAWSAGQSGLRPASTVFAAAVTWALSTELADGVCLRASAGDGLRIESSLGSGPRSTNTLVFDSHDVLTSSGKRRLCEDLLALRARLRSVG